MQTNKTHFKGDVWEKPEVEELGDASDLIKRS